jgi:hypothetical protein
MNEPPRYCFGCKLKCHRNMLILKCNNCESEYHPNCAYLSKEMAETIQTFYCNVCSRRFSNCKITYKKKPNPKYCICKTSDEDRFMIACDNCDDWYHGDCIKMSELRASMIDKFYCKLCKNRNPGLEIIYKKYGFVPGAISFDYHQNPSKKSRTPKT